jgi:hypothetical protein
MVSETSASRIAAAVAALALVVGLVVLGWEAASPQPGDAKTTHTESSETKVTAASTEKTDRNETVTADRDTDLLERAVGSRGLWVLRFLLVLAAAFLTGAAVQRILLGRYGVKLGPLEVPEIVTEHDVAIFGRLAELGIRASVAALPPYARVAAPDGRLPADYILYLDDATTLVIAFRVEVERRVRDLAAVEGVAVARPITVIIRSLNEAQALNADADRGLIGIIHIGTQAARCARVEEGVLNWIKNQGRRLLADFDTLEDGRRPMRH